MITPPLNTKGRFVLKAPWAASTDKAYSVISLRGFRELIADSNDILNNYYVPKGLTSTEYDADVKAGATLVILYAEDGEMLFVPDTYIQSFPSQSVPSYGNYVVSSQIGAFRIDYDFSFVKQKIAEVLSDTLGIEPTVNVDAIGESQIMTVENAENLEINRQAKITSRQTTYAKYLEGQKQITELQETVKVLQDALAAKS